MASIQVSFVIPVHNAAAWIEETLHSVLSQTVNMSRYEVIVVDDGSTDESRGMAARILSRSSAAHRILKQPNRGPSVARNLGYRVSSGEWIHFLDADDLIHSRKLEIQLECAESAPSTVAVVFSPWAKFGELDRRWERPGQVTVPDLTDDVVAKLLCGENSIATGAQLFRRTWLDKVGGWDENHSNGEDHDLAFRIAFAGGKFLATSGSKPMFFYRRMGASSKSLSIRSGRKNAEAWLRVARMVETESRARGELSPARVKRVAEIYAGFSKWLAEYDYSAARSWIRHLDNLSPNSPRKFPGRFGLVSKLVGFKNAVLLASVYSKVRILPDTAQYSVIVPAPDLRD